MTTPETLREDNQEIEVTQLENLTDQQVQQVSFTSESSDRPTYTETMWLDPELMNPFLQSWVNKILEKEAEWMFSEFEKNNYNYEKNGLSVETWPRFIETYHPDLLSFVCEDLWLPYDKDIYLHQEQWTKFSELTFEQKMNFMSLKRTFDYYKGNIANVSSEEFIDRFDSFYVMHLDVISANFNNTIKREGVELPDGILTDGEIIKTAYYINPKKLLKETYWLTDKEYEEFKAIADKIKENPEYLETQYQVEECGMSLKTFFEILWVIAALGLIILWLVKVDEYLNLGIFYQRHTAKKDEHHNSRERHNYHDTPHNPQHNNPSHEGPSQRHKKQGN